MVSGAGHHGGGAEGKWEGKLQSAAKFIKRQFSATRCYRFL